MMNKNTLLLLGFVLFIAPIAISQNVSDYEKMLTDDSFQEWKLDDTVTHLDDKCTNGVIYKFFKEENEVIRKTCIDSIWKIDNFQWTIEKKSNQFILKIEDKNFEIDFLSNPDIENADGTNIQLRLRKTVIDGVQSEERISSDKGIEVTDMYFNKS